MAISEAHEIPGDAPTALYRLYAEDNVLLYVGISQNPVLRFDQHAKEKPWWPLVVRKTAAWCDSAGTALNAEAAAISSENPVHNIRRPERKSKSTPARNIRINNDLWQAAVARTRSEHCTVTDVVIEALRAYVAA
jgi:predicted GIY-YIG superfamily endonuclease